MRGGGSPTPLVSTESFWQVAMWRQLKAKALSRLESRLDEACAAGVPSRSLQALRILVLAGTPMAFALGVFLFGLGGGFVGAACALWAFETGVRRAIDTERLKFRRCFPDAVDLLAVACMGGMNPYRAFRTVAGIRPEGCEALFEKAAALVSTGHSVSGVLVKLSKERDLPELAALSRAISGAERLGYPLGPVLMRLAHDLREREIRSAQAAARKAPVKVLFPLVFCILPAFVLLTVVPVLADTFSVIRQ